MSWNKRTYLPGLFCVLALPALAGAASSARTFPARPYYARRNSFGVFSAYSGDSSHMLLGYAENRKLLDFGVSYSRRLLINHIVNWQYDGELLPVALESDPTGQIVNNQTAPVVATYATAVAPLVSCAPVTEPYSYIDPTTGITYSGTETESCSGRRWTIGEAISPVGFEWNFLPLRRVQPIIAGHGGYMYSTQEIPIPGAGSFNFTFDIGAGFEYYRSQFRSIRVEYRYHHISNHGTADLNPGIDSGVFQVAYCFGR